MATILLLAVLLRIVDLPHKTLWYDELQTVTHSILPLSDLLQSVATFDPHPPLYYIQLHFWMLLGSTIWWIKLNSVVWSMLTAVLVYLVCRDLETEASHGTRLAWMAVLIFAIAPFPIFYAQEARMYAWLMLLAVGSHYAAQRFVQRGKWSNLVLLYLFTLAYLYSHGAGFMLLVSLGAYTIATLFNAGTNRWNRFLGLTVTQLVTLVSYVPWLISAYSINVGHTVTPTPHDIASTVYRLVLGFYETPAMVQWIFFSLFLGGTVLSIVAAPRLRPTVIGFIVAPMLFCALVSLYYRPIWHYRTLAFTTPFLGIMLAWVVLYTGEVLASFRDRAVLRYGPVIAAIAIVLAATRTQQSTFEYPWRIHAAARFLETALPKNGETEDPGTESTILYIPQERLLWGIGWHLAGPGSVDPFRLHEPLITPQGATLLNRNTAHHLPTTGDVWVVVRTIDDPSPFRSPSADTEVYDFHELHIMRASAPLE